MQLGIYTFAETTPDPQTGHTISPAQRLRNLMEEVALADQLGLEVYGVGESVRVTWKGEHLLRFIEIFGTEVAPLVRRATTGSATPTGSVR